MNIQDYISSGIVELYVMGLCSEEEKKELESLRKQYPELENAIADFEKELEEKMQRDILLPSAQTDERIIKSFGEFQETPVVNIKSSKRKITGFNLLAAASVILVVLCGYFIYSLNNKINKLEKQLYGESGGTSPLPLKDYKILLDPAITPVAMLGVGTHAICRCTMFWDKKTGKMYIIIHHLPQSSSSRDYQLWAMVNNQPVSVGILQDEIRGRFIEINGVPADATAFIVTLEKAGGNDLPTVEETYLSSRI